MNATPTTDANDQRQSSASGSKRVAAIVLLVLLTLLFVWWRSGIEPDSELPPSPASAAQKPAVPPDSAVKKPAGSGISPADNSKLIATANAVQQLLSRGEVARARGLLDELPADSPDQAQWAYLRGMCDWSEDKRASAEAEFQRAIVLKPGQTLAHASLGRLLEQQERLDEALTHYALVVELEAGNESARIDAARVLRKLGRLQEAERVLPIPLVAQVSQNLALEIAEREYSAGDYDSALQWFQRADLRGSHIAETLRTAASAMAMRGDYWDAQQLFARVDQAQELSRHAGELQRRLSIDPNDVKAQTDLLQINQESSEAAGPTEQPSAIYYTLCSACHGETGLADGRAARFLFPRPRNLQTDRLRLVSTLNAVAHPSDIERVIRRGIPGTSMPAFAKLNDEQVSELVGIITDFRRRGVSEQIQAGLAAFNSEPMADEDLTKLVALRTTPSELLDLPDFEAGTSASVERGKQVYLSSGCGLCHGEAGVPPTQLPLYDDFGRPSIPRDLVQDWMKGGDDAPSLYKRLRLGMPGTPHPALETSPTELVDLVHYCRSLSKFPKRTLTNQQRAAQAASRL